MWLEMELREVEKRGKSLENLHIVGFEEGRSATEICTAIRLMGAVARDWVPEFGFITCSLDVKQAFDNVSPLHLSLVMNVMNVTLVLAGATLREQIGGKYDICFQKRGSDIPLDRSIKQRGKRARACST